jgi:hypothetical protein
VIVDYYRWKAIVTRLKRVASINSNSISCTFLSVFLFLLHRFVITSQQCCVSSLGKISKLVLQHDNKHLSSGWYW